MLSVLFDPAKDAANLAKHGLSFARAPDLEVRTVSKDDRTDYGEPRYRAWGLLDGKPHILAYTRFEGGLRAISLRRVHRKEYRRHVGEG